jgi:hypothetical protein
VVVGRIIYGYKQGGWNEWHVVYNDSSSGWLSDAQLEYDLSWLTPPPAPLPAASELYLGRPFQFKNRKFEITSITTARYKGVQGELPFEYWNKQDEVFADLRTTDSNLETNEYEFATIDYSENPPLLFLGRSAEFDELHFKNLREFEGWS